MPTRIGVGALVAVVGLFILVIGGWAVGMVASGQLAATVIGAALLVLCAIGAWSLWQEIRFGIRSERLGRRLEAEGGMPPETVELMPSGRVRRKDGHALFPKYRDEVEASPDDWRTWYRLGLVYDAAGDRRRARSAVIRASRLEQDEQRRGKDGRPA